MDKSDGLSSWQQPKCTVPPTRTEFFCGDDVCGDLERSALFRVADRLFSRSFLCLLSFLCLPSVFVAVFGTSISVRSGVTAGHVRSGVVCVHSGVTFVVVPSGETVRRSLSVFVPFFGN